MPNKINNNSHLLSFSERRLWFMERFTPNNAFYNILIPVFFEESVDLVALNKAVNKIIDTHEILRSSYHSSGCEGIREVHESIDFKIIQLKSPECLTEANKENLIMEYAKISAKDPFNISCAPLFRSVLVQFSSTKESVMYIVMHHIITDKWTINIFLKELEELYNSYVKNESLELPKAKLKYSDFSLWQREWINSTDANEASKYWLAYLKDASPIVEFPTDYNRPKILLYSGNREIFEFDSDVQKKINVFLKKNGITPAIFFLAVWILLIYQYTKIEDITLGSTMGARFLPGTESVMGCFINIMLIRAKLTGKMTFENLISQLKNNAINSYANSMFPYEYIVEKLNPNRRSNTLPYCNIYYQFTNSELRRNQKRTIMFYKANSGKSRFDLMLNMWQTDDLFSGAIEFSTELFKKKTVSLLVVRLKKILREALENSSRTLPDYSLLMKVEKNQRLQWSVTSEPIDTETPIHKIFEKQAAKTPSAIAITAKEKQLTYLELNNLSNALAGELIKQGVKKNAIVAIDLERNECIIISWLAILKLGGTFLTLTHNFSDEKKEKILKNCKASYLIINKACRTKIKEYVKNVQFIFFEKMNQKKIKSLNIKISPSDAIACIIYTSGSTGEGKAIAISHLNITAFIFWAIKNYTKKQLCRTLASTDYCFDISIFEMLVPLCKGGQIYLVDSLLDYSAWEKADISLLNTVPSVILNLLNSVKKLPKSLKTINLAGETLSTELIKTLYERSSISKLYNLYGLTETTIYSTCNLLKKGEQEGGIGTPISNTQVYILSDNLTHAPIGSIGEIYIGGLGLSSGYIKEGKLYNHVLIKNPYSSNPSDFLYKTGDLARYAQDGSIHYIGRSDFQFKYHGFRIQPAQVENALLQYSGISNAVVSMGEFSLKEPSLFACYTTNKSEKINEIKLKSHLKRHLPNYMVPNYFFKIDQIPLLPNSKLDREAIYLLAEEFFSKSSNFIKKEARRRTKMEKIIFSIWRKILKTSEFELDSNFFDLGGHSFLATSVISEITKKINFEIPLRTIYDYPTIESLAKFLEKKDIFKKTAREKTDKEIFQI